MRKHIALKIRLSSRVASSILDRVELPRSTFGVVVIDRLRAALADLPAKLDLKAAQGVGDLNLAESRSAGVPPIKATQAAGSEKCGLGVSPSEAPFKDKSLDPLDREHRIWLDPDLYNRIESVADRFGLNISGAIDALLWRSIIDLPAKFPDSNLAGKSAETELPCGHLKPKHTKYGIYYYWQYYKREGDRADKYLAKNRDQAIAKARAIGMPEDANPKYHRRTR